VTPDQVLSLRCRKYLGPGEVAPKQSDYGLSEREKEILQLMTTGLIKKEIADQLTLSIHTVDTYLRRIYEKLEVNTRTGAVAKALKEGLV
jgi:DNA-binding CsgD family transcriptional regulator